MQGQTFWAVGAFYWRGGPGRRPSRRREPTLEPGRESFYWLVGGFYELTIVCRRGFWVEGLYVGAELLNRAEWVWAEHLD